LGNVGFPGRNRYGAVGLADQVQAEDTVMVCPDYDLTDVFALHNSPLLGC